MWTVLFSQRFDDWLNEQEDALQEKVLADLKKLQVYGPELPVPYADTVKGSRYKNMKELRVQFSGRPIRAFMRSIRFAGPSFFVQETKVTINGFMKNWCV